MNLEVVDEKQIPTVIRQNKTSKWAKLRGTLMLMPNDDPTKWVKIEEVGTTPKRLALLVRMSLSGGTNPIRVKILRSDTCIYVRKRIPGIDFGVPSEL